MNWQSSMNISCVVFYRVFIFIAKSEYEFARVCVSDVFLLTLLFSWFFCLNKCCRQLCLIQRVSTECERRAHAKTHINPSSNGAKKCNENPWRKINNYHDRNTMRAICKRCEKYTGTHKRIHTPSKYSTTASIYSQFRDCVVSTLYLLNKLKDLNYKQNIELGHSYKTFIFSRFIWNCSDYCRAPYV